ncbi:MAG: HAMP domain-containing sensor histidine kinase [Sneathiellaceae bacterium]
MDRLSRIFSHDLPDATRREVDIERLLQLNAHQLVAAVASFFNPILLVMSIWRPEMMEFLVGWCLVGWLIAGLQFRSWRRNRHKPRPRRAPRNLSRRVFQWAIVGGAYWGLVGVVMTPIVSESELLLMCLVMFGMGVGGAMALAVVPVAGIGFLLVAYLPQVVMIYLRYPGISFELAILVVNFFLFVSLVVLRIDRGFVRSTASAIENQRLALEARSADAAKSQFIANMSHELRTPLNAIIGYSELMTLEMFGPLGTVRYRDYAGYIQNSGGHLLSIVNDMIDISRIEAGELSLEIEPVDLRDMVQECLDLFERRASEGSVRLRQAAIDPVVISVDRRAMRQVMFNLLSNAIKFTPEGGSVTVAAQADIDGAATLSVADSGIGMTQDEITVALTRFGKVASALVSNAGGAGLGLTLSQQLLSMHGGRLTIHSTPGVGTRVDVELPPGSAAPRASGTNGMPGGRAPGCAAADELEPIEQVSPERPASLKSANTAH